MNLLSVGTADEILDFARPSLVQRDPLVDSGQSVAVPTCAGTLGALLVYRLDLRRGASVTLGPASRPSSPG